MNSYETVASGRSKRSTAGNRMRELLEKAHQEDEDELFAEVADDEEFVAPQDQRDVFLEDFADTDDEVELDEEEQEREMRREERRKAKGKAKAAYNPLAPKQKQTRFDAGPSTSTTATTTLLDPSIDPTTMAPSTLVLALRKQRREAKRANRSEARRSNLRASTLRTEAEVAEKEKQEKLQPNRKGRRAQHETGEIRGARPMTQDELIAAALEEEERNKEALSAWIRREEERRELRRVGRKRVRGPRWTWISRTVGKLVEVVDAGAAEAEVEVVAGPSETSKMPSHSPPPADPNVPAQQPEDSELRITDISSPTDNATASNDAQNTVQCDQPTTDVPASEQAVQTSAPPAAPPADLDKEVAPTPEMNNESLVDGSIESDKIGANAVPPSEPMNQPDKVSEEPSEPIVPPAVHPSQDSPTVISTGGAALSEGIAETSLEPPVPQSDVDKAAQPEDAEKNPAITQETEASKYTRNYLVLSQVPGGLPAELKVILGDHVEWDEVKFIPARNRPINRRPTICPFTGLPAKYRHPTTMIPYATVAAFKQIEALLANRYVWNEVAHCWFGGEEDVAAEGVEDIDGWWEAVNGGWLGGQEIPLDVEPETLVSEEATLEEDPIEAEPEPVAQVKSKGKRKRGIGSGVASASTPEVTETRPAAKKAKGKGRKKSIA